MRQCAKRREVESEGRKPTRIIERIVLEVALGSGLRVSEIAGLACGDISPSSSSGSIRVRRGKGGKPRTVVISGELTRLLEKFLHRKRLAGEQIQPDTPLLASKPTGKNLSTRALQKMFARLRVAAGVRYYRFHDLRHTYGSFLLQSSGNDLVFVKDQMGHSDLMTTAVYLHALNAEKAVNGLYVVGG